MSSETVLFDATWNESGRGGTRSLVARLAPEDSAVPVFPRYDLDRQARVIRLVGERTDVPVPRVRWFEPDPTPLGSPFIVMDRVEGAAPPDVMPYNFGSWLMDASLEDQRRLQDASVRILAEIHGVEATDDELAFLDGRRAGRHAAPSARERPGRVLRVGARRRSPRAGDRGRLRVDRGPLARTSGHGARDGHQLGRLADRQHPLPRLRAGGGARLGDGRGRAARGRHRLDDLHPRLLRARRAADRVAGHAALHAPRRCRRHLRGGLRGRAAQPRVLRAVRRTAPRDRDGPGHAARRSTSASRRCPPIPTSSCCTACSCAR